MNNLPDRFYSESEDYTKSEEETNFYVEHIERKNKWEKYREDKYVSKQKCFHQYDSNASSETPSIEIQDSLDFSSEEISFPDYTFDKYDSKSSIISHSQEYSKTPKIVHQMWKDHNLPPNFEKWRNVWLDMCSDYEHKFYTDEDLRDLIKNELPEYLKAYDSFSYNIERVDFSRYAILYLYGGIYADLDTAPLKSLDRWLEENKIVLGTEPVEHRNMYGNQEVLCNALMISPKGDKFWLHLMDYISEHYINNNSPVHTTGPMAITRFRKENPEFFENIIITDPSIFYPLTNKNTSKHQEYKGKNYYNISHKCDIKDAFVVHYWANSWTTNSNTSSLVSGIVSFSIAGLLLLLLLILINLN